MQNENSEVDKIFVSHWALLVDDLSQVGLNLSDPKSKERLLGRWGCIHTVLLFE